MAWFEVLAGDFPTGKHHQFNFGMLNMAQAGKWLGAKYRAEDIEHIEQVTEENKHRVGRTVGWAVAGTLIAGPLGAIAGGWLGGKRNDVTFVCRLKDGKSFVGVMDVKSYTKLAAPFLLQRGSGMLKSLEDDAPI